MKRPKGMRFAAFLAFLLALLPASANATPVAPDFKETISSFSASTQDNMNGKYVISTTPNGKPPKDGSTVPDGFPKRYADYPGGVESYDIYSPPMTTLYSQVWWSPLAPVKLPDELVKKYGTLRQPARVFTI